MKSHFRVFISKKMKTAQNNLMTAMLWNKKNQLLACGYSNGDVILHQVNESKSQPGTLQASTIQSLTQHQTQITAVEWTPSGDFLFTGDKSGKIIIWSRPRKMWKLQLTISSNDSAVQFLRWNPKYKILTCSFNDSTCTCVDLNGEIRWSNKIRQQIILINFSSNFEKMYFGTAFGEVLIFTLEGIELSSIQFPCLSNSNVEPKLVSIENNYRSQYRLLIAFNGGQAQLMRNENDTQPIVVKVNAQITCAKWFNNGQFFSLGILKEDNTSSILFFNSEGVFLRELDISSSAITHIGYNFCDTQIAICLGDNLFLLQILPNFLCAYTKNTLAYAFHNSNDESSYSIVYFNRLLNQKVKIQNIDNVINISNDHDNFAIFSKQDSGACRIVIVDPLGIQIATTNISFIPTTFSLSNKKVAFASSSKIGIWPYENENSEIIDIDDQIKSICLFNDTLFASIEDHIIYFDGQSLNEKSRYKINFTAEIIQSSCDMKRLSLIDSNSTLRFYNIETSRLVGPTRKELSNPLWSSKIPSMIAASERSKLTVYDNMIPDESYQTLSISISLDEIELITVNMMEIMQNPLEPSKKFFKSYPTKFIRTLKKMLSDRPIVTIESIMNYVKEQHQPKLWDELAQILLIENNLSLAEKCYLENFNYPGLQFIKRIRNVRDPQLQRAQILFYFGRFDDAQTIYESIDRIDLAVEMRSLIGDYQSIINLLGTSSSDDTVSKAFENLGQLYIEQNDWQSAVKVYQKSKNKAKLALALFMTNDYEGLNKLLKKQTSRSQILPLLGQIFLSMGASNESVIAFEKSGEIQSAIEASIRLNNFKYAFQLCSNEQNQGQQKLLLLNIKEKMNEYVNKLIENGQFAAAVEFYSDAGLEIESAKLLIKEGDKQLQAFQFIISKQFYIFAGLKLLEYIRNMEKSNFEFQETSNLLNEIWRKAEAVHFYVLAHKFLRMRKWKNALFCSIRVFDMYSNIIGENRAAGLLAVCGLKTGFMHQCSKGFTSLESFDDYSEKEKKRFEDLAIDIFLNKPPVDPKIKKEIICPKCSNELSEVDCQCNECGYNLTFCVASGVVIDDDRYTCSHCQHSISLSVNMSELSVCPFCHQTIDF